MTFLNPKAVVAGDSLSVTELLPSRYLIPDNQRDFAWGAKQIGQLWDDLTEHYGRVAPNDDITKPDGFFLGAFVVVEEQSDGILQVVDGQQRLTTLSLMAAVLHEALENYAASDPRKAAVQHALKTCWLRYESGSFVPWITYSDAQMDAAFRGLCLQCNDRKSRRSLWKDLPKKQQKKGSSCFALNAAFAVSYRQVFVLLRKAKPPVRTQRIINFAQMLLECVVLLRIKVTSYDSAYAIFESLNDRGLRLSQADLIKNELLRVAVATERDETVEFWTDTKQVLEDTPITLPELLHYSCLHRLGTVKAQSLFAFVKARIGPGRSARTFAQNLQQDSDALEAMLVNRPTTWTKSTHQMLDDIAKVLSVKFSYPMLLGAHRRFALNTVLFEKAVRLIMNFTFRFMKVGAGSPEKLAQVAAQVGAIFRSKDSDNDVVLQVSQKFTAEAPDNQFLEDFKLYSEANTKQAYFSVYYIELHLLNGTIPLGHGAESNLEHIMPKAPTASAWPKAFALKASDPNQYAEMLWRIGNLLPLPEAINKSIKNKSIQYKMNGGSQNYSTCTLATPITVSQYLSGAEWDDAAIEKRQQYLATIAPLAWSLAP